MYTVCNITIFLLFVIRHKIISYFRIAQYFVDGYIFIFNKNIVLAEFHEFIIYINRYNTEKFVIFQLFKLCNIPIDDWNGFLHFLIWYLLPVNNRCLKYDKCIYQCIRNLLNFKFNEFSQLFAV